MMKVKYILLTIFVAICVPICFSSPTYSATDSINSNIAAADTLMSKQLDEVTVAADLNRVEGNKDIITITKAMREGTHNSGELLGKVAGMMYNPLSTEPDLPRVKECHCAR